MKSIHVSTSNSVTYFGTAPYWLLQDRLQSVREVLSASGIIVSMINYDAFGKVLSETGPSQSGDYLYQGMRRNRFTLMDETPHRDYMSWVARWLQVDPAYADVNLYRGMGNNGANMVDPSGLQEQDSRELIARSYATQAMMRQRYAAQMGYKGALPNPDHVYQEAKAKLGVDRYEPNPQYNDWIAKSIKVEEKVIVGIADVGEEVFYQTPKRTILFGSDLAHAWDPEFRDFKTERGRKFFLTKEAEYLETWGGATLDTADTLLLVNPFGKARKGYELVGFEAKIAEREAVSFGRVGIVSHAPKPNLNSNSAVSTFGVYEIRVDGQLHKIGKADLERITQSTGLPTRLHQQVRKLQVQRGEGAVVEGKVVEPLGKMTTAEAKAAERARLDRYYEETQKIPVGNQNSYKKP